MTTPHDIAALRELYDAAQTDPNQRFPLALAAVSALPALLDRLERAERDSQRFRSQLERVVGVHNAPNDCYATGPMTGDEYLDLVSCPSCEAVAMLSAPNTPTPEQP